MSILKSVIGVLLIVSGIFNSYKYVWQAQKIKKVKTAKGQSRKFINTALADDIIRISYSIVIRDLYIFLVSLLAFVTMSYLFFIIYLYYPYRHRGLNNFKRPNLLLYTINSILPNSIRKCL